jgi:hypothetical protein
VIQYCYYNPFCCFLSPGQLKSNNSYHCFLFKIIQKFTSNLNIENDYTKFKKQSPQRGKGVALSNKIDIETYAHGWLEPVHLERLYADVLTKNQGFANFTPEEIFIENKKGITASQVAGALSAAIIGVGWKKVSIPTTIVQFQSCPVSFGVFSRREDFTTINFVTSLPLQANKDGLILVVAQIKSREEGGKLQIKYDSTSSPEIVQELNEDTSLSSKLASLCYNELLYTLPFLRSNIGVITLEGRNGILCLSTKFQLDKKKKKWKKAIEENNMKPEDFIGNTFGAACLIASHVQKQVANSISHRSPERR